MEIITEVLIDKNIITNLIVNSEKLVKYVQLPNINYEQHLKKNLLTQFKNNGY